LVAETQKAGSPEEIVWVLLQPNQESNAVTVAVGNMGYLPIATRPSLLILMTRSIPFPAVRLAYRPHPKNGDPRESTRHDLGEDSRYGTEYHLEIFPWLQR